MLLAKYRMTKALKIRELVRDSRYKEQGKRITGENPTKTKKSNEDMEICVTEGGETHTEASNETESFTDKLDYVYAMIKGKGKGTYHNAAKGNHVSKGGYTAKGGGGKGSNGKGNFGKGSSSTLLNVFCNE